MASECLNPLTTNSSLTFSFSIASPGSYYIYGLMAALDGSNDSFYFNIDGGEYLEWHIEATGSNEIFEWSQATKRQAENLGPLEFSSGMHEIKMACREDGAIIDALVLSKSSTFNGL